MGVLVNGPIIWEVHDNYQKQTYRNRYHICTDQGLHKLSIPIKHVGGQDGRQKYAEVQIDNGYKWQQQHWRTLQTAYRTSPFFEFYEDELAPLFEKRFTHLMDFNWAGIEFMTDALLLDFPKEKTAAYSGNPEAAADLRILVNAKKGPKPETRPYTQVFSDRHGFIGNLSTLDLLFNEGSNALSYLKQLTLDFKDA